MPEANKHMTCSVVDYFHILRTPEYGVVTTNNRKDRLPCRKPKANGQRKEGWMNALRIKCGGAGVDFTWMPTALERFHLSNQRLRYMFCGGHGPKIQLEICSCLPIRL